MNDLYVSAKNSAQAQDNGGACMRQKAARLQVSTLVNLVSIYSSCTDGSDHLEL